VKTGKSGVALRFATAIHDAPWTAVAERSGDGAFVWIGDVFSSGKPEHRTHFRPIAD